MALQNEDKNKEENKKTKQKWQKSYFDVLGICCPSEVPLIVNILKSLDGIKEYSVIVPTRTVIVVHDSLLISPSQIVKALNHARLEANVKVDGKTSFKNKWPSPFAMASGILLLLSFFKFLYAPAGWIAVAAVAAGIYPILAKAVASIGNCRVDINILIIITVAATLAMQDYMEAAAVVFLFTIAEWLETRASYKANAVMQSLMSLAPQKAIIAETGEEVEVDDVMVNTILAVKAGETIPIDGIVVDGNCEVDEKTLTGEAFPVPKQKDSTVWAGTINLNGYISVKTTALASDCVVTKMAKLVEEAQSSKTKSQRLIDQCSKYYTPAIILVSGCIAAVPAIMKVHNLNHWFHLALVVLVSACPCGLILSTPVATFCALTKAATSGLLIKSADYLDILSKIKITAFDKTGTITRGEFIVVDFKSLHRDISLRTLLYWVSSVESKSSHPMAATIVDYAKSVDVEPRTEEVEDYQNFPGEGIYGKIDGNDVYIGNKRIASRAKCSTVPEIEVDTKGGKTVGYIYVGERLAGVFNLSDACRSGVLQAMNELKDLGIKTAMLTGDNQDAAMHAQEKLGNALDVVHGELLPEDKSRIIQEFKKEGPTAMVGDGVNDAPALATADIGISMGISGSALATQTGHIILMSNDIRRIPQAIKLARSARSKVVQNVFLSIIFKVGILILAICGHPLIWAAVLVDVGTCLLVILNSMLLLREKDKGKNKKCYRSSVLNGKKLEGEADGELDLEAGLLSQSQCNSGCCGDKKAQEKVMKKQIGKSSSDHGHSGGCCSDKKAQEKVVMKKPSSKSSSDHGHSGGCCGDKKTQEKVVMKKPSSKSSSDHGHSGGCCSDKKQDNVKVLVKDSCCGEKTKKPDGDMASTSSCKKSTHVDHDMKLKGGSGCCTKDKEKNVEMQILGEEVIDLEKGLKKNAGEDCKTSCCGTKEKAMESSYLEKDVLIKETVKQTEEITLASEEETGSLDCWLGSCESKTTVKQSCHEKTSLDIEAGVSCDLKLACCGSIEGEELKEQFDLEVKSEGQCTSVCCGDEKQTGEITLACEEGTDGSDCCHEKDCLESEPGVIYDLKLVCCENTEGEVREKCDLEKGLQVKNQGECKSDCCDDEITLASGCCGSNKEVTQICCGTGLKQEGSSSLVNVVESGSKVREMVKLSSQSCCTNPTELVLSDLKKVETCCKVKTPEACGSKCKVKEKHHIGKSCCRSYAKAYCSHRHHHHHHHHGHHHHHHVGAA
ncbi:putative cadmium/zinc-transporting ATPase HMA4 [Raphanus sativus]|uniref:Cadmium/zinc-transporting ATPase HMA3 n=1 Tax=Raphanus sativus TaxID=3726 RepID=A0A6J0K0L5_RAPSA|nr:cadmium/zinc-transporting ATPase HMA3 [Raphanus sativus]KAJ4888969.1 putative cadmium/zinc-transporting ATPase HMA4 [Raphanus sativus]